MVVSHVEVALKRSSKTHSLLSKGRLLRRDREPLLSLLTKMAEVSLEEFTNDDGVLCLGGRPQAPVEKANPTGRE